MKIIIAPIHLDALLLPHHTIVKDAFADYTRLPYTDAIRDYNPDIPYLGEAILNHPFQDKNLMLGAGVHLHWAFPKGLSKTLGVPLLKESDLDELRPYFPPDLMSDANTWQKTRKYISSTIY